MKQAIVEAKDINKICNKDLSSKIPLLMNIIIKCIIENPILMNRAIALFPLIHRNHSNVFKESFCSALQQ